MLELKEDLNYQNQEHDLEMVLLLRSNWQTVVYILAQHIVQLLHLN